MSIQKKSLISTLKTAKKANFAGKEVKGEKQVSAIKVVGNRSVSAKSAKSAKQLSGKSASNFRMYV